MAVSKVVLSDGRTLIDLTADTITADKLAEGYTAHGADGAAITGTSTLDSDTQDATAQVAEILVNKTAYARGAKLTGTMPNRGGITGDISTVSGTYTIQQGYHDGSGSVGIAASEQAKIIAGNIKNGIEILGVTGTYGGEEAQVQSKTATPSWESQTITPDTGYDYLSQVTVNAIPYAEAPNAAGGVTVTIG